VSFYPMEFDGEPAIGGKKIRVVLFTDPAGKGAPQGIPALAIDRYVTIPGADRWVEIPVAGPTPFSGDLCLGYEAPGAGWRAKVLSESL